MTKRKIIFTIGLYAVLLATVGSLAWWLYRSTSSGKQVDGVAVILGFASLIVLSLTLYMLIEYTDETQKMREATKEQADATAQMVVVANKQTQQSNEMIEISNQQLKQAMEMARITNLQAAELSRQVRLSLLPSFVARVGNFPGVQSPQIDLFLSNVGNGTAFNVKVYPVSIVKCGEPDSNMFALSEMSALSEYVTIFGSIPSIRPQTSEVSVPHTYVLASAIKQEMSALMKYRGMTGANDLQYLNEKTPLQIRFQDIEGSEYEQVLRVSFDGCNSEAVRLVKVANNHVLANLAPIEAGRADAKAAE